jgi:RpiR family carbohydrate utilization transcriptional regulator
VTEQDFPGDAVLFSQDRENVFWGTLVEALESVPVLSLIRRKSQRMSPALQNIAEFVVTQPEKVVKMSITQLAVQTGVRSESSIVKFYRAFGFSGYHDFKVTLATELAGTTLYHSYEDISVEDGVGDIKRKIFQGAAQTLRENILAIRDETLVEAVDLLQNASRIIFLGYASSGAIAYDACFMFTRLGYSCHFAMDSHLNAVALADPREGDVIFCISHSGESKDIVIPVSAAKPPAKVIALTGAVASPLSQIADVCITTDSEEMNYRTDVMVSRIVQLALIETLFFAVSLRKGPAVWDRLKKTRQALSYLKY